MNGTSCNISDAPVAQSEEQSTFNRRVVGSKPTGGTFCAQNLPDRVRDKIRTGVNGECWQWVGAIQSSGYGSLVIDGRHYLAHRYTYEVLAEPIPDGLQIDHLCQNKRCCNPAHLEPVTAKENNARKFESQKLRCVHGHPLVGENLRIKTLPNGQKRRVCRVCVIDICRKHRQAQGASRVHPKSLRRRAAILEASERTLAEYIEGGA